MSLATNYLGLELKNPLVPSASPLSRELDTAKQLEDAGASAIVMYSLFEEEITSEEEELEILWEYQDIGHGEAGDYLPVHYDFRTIRETYLEQIAALKNALDIPIIASLNGATPSGWTEHAKEIQDAGADALELNVYYVAGDIRQSGAAIEQRYLDLLQSLRQSIEIPINMKLSPTFSSLGNMVKRIEAAGADGVSLFNRFYQPDINIDRMRLVPSLHPSTSAEALLAMRWVAILYGRTDLALGATGGIHTTEDAIKLLLAGADAVHLCSTLLNNGASHLGVILSGIAEWMEANGFEHISDVRGRVSQVNVPNPAEFERANYVKILDSYSFSPGVQV